MGKKAYKALKDEEKRREAFEAFYSDIWKDRWPELKAALLEESTPEAYDKGLLKPYFLDRASVIAASLLPVKSGDNVLDMCAAPGGKTLVLASRGEGRISITANDRSRDRKLRLDAVISEYLPAEYSSLITTTNYDASRYGMYHREEYDAVLLDAPCSSERHVLHSAKHMAMWSLSRPKRLAIEQFALLCSALDAVKPGGHILYSTCAVNPAEDELVIERLLERRKDLVREIRTETEYGEEREHGRIILPDSHDNLGPLYFALLEKI